MLQPPIAVVPKQFTLSQTFPANENGSLRKKAGAGDSGKALNLSSGGATQSRTRSVPKKAATLSHFFRDPSSTEGAANVMPKEDALVLNLKQQVQCLELEVQYLKQQQQAPSVTSPASGSPTAIAAALNQTIGSASAVQRATRDELAVRAQELEAEVLDLRQKYALREQSFQLELATLRQKISSESKSAGTSQSVHEALLRREAELTQSIATLKQLHAQEVVALQRTIERLMLETEDRQSHIAHLTQEKESLLKEIVSLREEARSALSATDSAKKQLEQAMVHVATEQGARRAAEVRDTAARQDAEGLSLQCKSLEAKLSSALEAKQRSEADALTAGYELDQLRLTIQRQKEELGRATQDAVQAKAKTSEVVAKFSDLEGKLAKAAQGLVDLQSEREYFRLQVDRLKVENSVLEVKASQLEQALNAERATAATMERQLCAALEQADALRRESRSKEEVYRKVDAFSTEVRVQLRTAEEERSALQKRLEETSDALAKAQSRLEHVKSIEDQQRTEQQLQQALIQLSRSKLEMQSILLQQQRVADAFNVALDDLPEVSVNRSYHHHNVQLNATLLDRCMHPPLGGAEADHHSLPAVISQGAAAPVAVTVTETLDASSPAVVPQSMALESTSTAPIEGPLSSLSATITPLQSTEEIRRELQAMTERIQDEERRAAELLLLRSSQRRTSAERDFT